MSCAISRCSISGSQSCAPNRSIRRARDILRLGLYQILLIETAAHAAVFETVELARPRARSLINAILRRALREKDALTNAAGSQPPSIRFSTPEFLIEKWSHQFDAAAAVKLCQWNNQPAPVYARINELQNDGCRIPAPPSTVAFCCRGARTLSSWRRCRRSACERGDCYIQDPSTAIACELLRPAPGETVLDACAAPGGKAAYLAEMMKNEGMLVAADRDETRLATPAREFR